MSVETWNFAHFWGTDTFSAHLISSHILAVDPTNRCRLRIKDVMGSVREDRETDQLAENTPFRKKIFAPEYVAFALFICR